MVPSSAAAGEPFGHRRRRVDRGNDEESHEGAGGGRRRPEDAAWGGHLSDCLLGQQLGVGCAV
jgi:hypothetical protein